MMATNFMTIRLRCMVMVAAVLMMPAFVLAGSLQTGQCYTWGINTQKALSIEDGRVITEAVLTFHNFGSDVTDVTTVTTVSSGSRSLLRGTTTTTTVETPNFDSLHVYVLDNPRFGLTSFYEPAQNDPFAGYGGRLEGVYENGNLVYHFTQSHDADSPFSRNFGGGVQLSLANGTTADLSSSLLELIDYAGTGVSFGVGIRPGQVNYYYDDITLILTVQSFNGAAETTTIVYHIGDDMSDPAADDQEDIEPEPEPEPEEEVVFSRSLLRR